MKRLYLLRHAKSSWDDQSLDDRDRPLAARGERAAARMADHLKDEAISPQLVLCSPARRTRETLDRIADALGDTQVEIEPRLYGASETEVADRLRELPGEVESVMLIGHNPGLEDLALGLAGRGERLEDLRQKFPTAALATLELELEAWGQLGPGRAELTAYVKPKELS